MLIAICDDEQFFLDYFEKTIKDYYYYDPVSYTHLHYLTTGIISLNDVLAESKKRHVSLTAFIVSVMIFSIMQMRCV